MPAERTEKVLEGTPDPAHLRQLMHFLAVARAGGMRRAVPLAGVRQPALSKSVHALEARYDQALFVRKTRGLELTPFGRALLERCEAIEALVAEPPEARPEALAGDLRIATQGHVATYLLPGFVSALRRAHPKLRVRISAGPSHLLLPELERGLFDFGIFFLYPEARAFTRRALGRYPCQIVIAPDRLEDLEVRRTFLGSREIDDAGNQSFPTLDHLRKRDPATSIEISSNSLESHRAMVLAGCGVSILPRFVVEEDLHHGRLALLDPDYVYRARLDLVRYQGRRPTPQARAALALLRERGLDR